MFSCSSQRLFSFWGIVCAKMRGNSISSESNEQLVLLPWCLWDVIGTVAYLELVGEKTKCCFLLSLSPPFPRKGFQFLWFKLILENAIRIKLSSSPQGTRILQCMLGIDGLVLSIETIKPQTIKHF